MIGRYPDYPGCWSNQHSPCRGQQGQACIWLECVVESSQGPNDGRRASAGTAAHLPLTAQLARPQPVLPLPAAVQTGSPSLLQSALAMQYLCKLGCQHQGPVAGRATATAGFYCLVSWPHSTAKSVACLPQHPQRERRSGKLGRHVHCWPGWCWRTQDWSSDMKDSGLLGCLGFHSKANFAFLEDV